MVDLALSLAARMMLEFEGIRLKENFSGRSSVSSPGMSSSVDSHQTREEVKMFVGSQGVRLAVVTSLPMVVSFSTTKSKA